MFAKNSEASFVFNGVTEFIKAWESGSKTKLTLQSKNGLAWLNFSCCLGGPHDEHQKLKKPKSKKKRERDNLRAQLHQQRLQDGLSSSSNLPKSDVGERAASALKTTTNSSDINTKDPVQADSAEESTPKVIFISDSLNESRNDSIEIEVVKDKNLKEFKCELCDFVSIKERELNIHMMRVHTKIEQIDGVLDESQLEDKQGQEISEREEKSETDKIIVWNKSLDEKTTEWQQMVIDDPGVDLFLIQFEFFKKAKTDMCNSDLFEAWYSTARSNYGGLIILPQGGPMDPIRHGAKL